MELLIVGALIGVTCMFLGIFLITANENQKKKNMLIEVVTKALIELNQNKDILKQILLYIKPDTDNSPLEIDMESDKKYPFIPFIIEEDSLTLKYEDIQQLKLTNEFLTYAEIKTSIELNNVIFRIKYLNKIFSENSDLKSLSHEEYKTIYHTHEMVDRLIKNLEKVLNKLKA